MYSQELRVRYLEALRQRLTPKRLVHSLGVEKMAVDLAQKYGEDAEKAAIAGLLHDYAKYTSDEQMLAYAREFGIPLCHAYEAQPNLLHGPVGAKLAERELGICDAQVLAAIARHTTGARGMSRLEEIVYLSDLLEENREFDGVEQLRQALDFGLEHALERALAHELAYLQARGGEVHPDTAAAYQWVIEKRREQNGKF